MEQKDFNIIVKLLNSKQQQYKGLVLQSLLALSSTQQGLEQLHGSQEQIIADLVYHLGSADFTQQAGSLLVNMTTHNQIAQYMIINNYFIKILIFLHNNELLRGHHNMVMVVQNLSLQEQACHELTKDQNQRHLQLLIELSDNKKGIKVASDEGIQIVEVYEHVPSILNNLIMDASIRSKVMQKDNQFLQKIEKAVQDQSLLRSQSGAQAIRNLTLKSEDDNTIDELIERVGLVQILQNLIGLPESTKIINSQTRNHLLEALLILNQSTEAVQQLKDLDTNIQFVQKWVSEEQNEANKNIWQQIEHNLKFEEQNDTNNEISIIQTQFMY